MFRSWLLILKIQKIQKFNAIADKLSKKELVWMENLGKLLFSLKYTFFATIMYILGLFSLIIIGWNLYIITIFHNLDRAYEFIDKLLFDFYSVQLLDKNIILPYLMVLLIGFYCLFNADFISKHDSKSYLYTQYLKIDANHYYKIKHIQVIFVLIFITVNAKLYLSQINNLSLILLFLFNLSFATVTKLWFLLEYKEIKILNVNKYLTSIIFVTLLCITAIIFNIRIEQLANPILVSILGMITLFLNLVFFSLSYKPYVNKRISIYNLKQSKIQVDASNRNLFAFNLNKITNEPISTTNMGITYYFDIFKTRLKKQFFVQYYESIFSFLIFIFVGYSILTQIPIVENNFFNLTRAFSIYVLVFYYIMQLQLFHKKNYYNYDIYLQKLNLLNKGIKEIVHVKEQFYLSFFLIPTLILSGISTYFYYLKIENIGFNLLLIWLGFLLLSYLIIKVSVVEMYTYKPFINDITVYRDGYIKILVLRIIFITIVLIINAIVIPGIIFVVYIIYYIWLKYNISQKN